MRILLLTFLAASASAATFPVSLPDELRAPPRSRDHVRLATSGDTTLAVWVDQRSHTTLRGRMLDRDRVPISDRDFLVHDIAGSSLHGPPLAVAAGGVDYLVAHSVGYTHDWTTRFTRVTAAGEATTGSGVVDGHIRSIAFAGGHYFVVTAPIDKAWGRAHIAIVDPHGRVLREGIPVAEDDAARDARLVAASDGKLLIVWNVWNANEMGTALVDPAELFASTWTGAPRKARIENMRLDLGGVVEGKGGFLIASIDRWRDGALLMLALLHPDATLRSREDIRNPVEHSAISELAVARVQDEYSVIANEVYFGNLGYRLGSLRVTDTGARPLGGFQSFSQRNATSMAFVRRPDGWLTWAFIERHRVEAAAAATSSDGALRSGGTLAFLSRSWPEQEYPAVAHCNGTNIVAWQDTGNEHAIVRFRRFSASGEPLDPPNRALSTFEFFEFWRSDVSIACGNANALITWREPLHTFGINSTGRVRGAIVKPGGTISDLGDLGQAFHSRAVFDGNDFVILNYDPDGGRHQWQRWREQGSRRSTQRMADFPGTPLIEFDLAWNGSTFMVVTENAVYEDGVFGRDIVAQEMRSSFFPEGAPLTLAEDLSYTNPESPVLAARPGGWLASWWECDAEPCGARSSALTGSSGPVVSAKDSMPLQASWNGTAFELLTEDGLVQLDAEGRRTGFHRFTERVDAIAATGTPRMFVFRRYDRASGAMLLFAGLVDVTEPQRRRTSRH